MTKKVLDKFSVEWMQVLDENGRTDRKLMPKLAAKTVQKMYEMMVLTRVFDDKAFKLQRQGRLGTYGQSIGQEASAVGSAMALSKKDWIFPSFREHGVFITMGVPLAQYFQYWNGDERGNIMPADVNILPVSVPVGTHIPHAVGLAWAMKMKKERSVSAAYFGDGATSKGDFHEALNFAGVYKVPCVFICQNNQWAISLPFSRQTAAKTVAQKAVAYGIPGVRVDGNDVFAVYRAVKNAADSARKGNGPSLIECFTYRMGDHTTSDDSKKYRQQKEVDAWRKKDPIMRLEKYMIKKKLLNEKKKVKIWELANSIVDKAVREYEAIERPDPTDMFRYLYRDMPKELKDQLAEFQDTEKGKSSTKGA
jgi:pyruvate dehydrogenase E1 component alpha subunit